MSKKVLILAGDAVEALEMFYSYYRLLEEGIEVVIAAPAVKKIHTVIHDDMGGWDTYTEKPGYVIQAHASFDEIDPAHYDGLLIPGGRAPEYIRLNPNAGKVVRHFMDNDKPVGAICHGVQVFEPVRDLFQNRSLAAYIGCSPSVEAMGARYVDERLHVDGNLVTAHAWPDLPGFMKAFLKLL